MVIAGYTPSFEPIGLGLVTTAALATAGWIVFVRREPTLADYI
jgi:hypothetical protein